MPNPLSQTNREQQFNSSNDIYQLKRLNCEAVLGEYQAGSQLSLEGQRAKRLSLLLLKGEALLIQNPSPDLTPPQQKNSDIPPQDTPAPLFALLDSPLHPNQTLTQLKPGQWYEFDLEADVAKIEFTHSAESVEFWMDE